MREVPYIDMRGYERLMASGRSVFSGNVYISGIKITGLNSDSTKPWVKVDLTANPPTATEDAGPAPAPFPPGIEYYEKKYTAGDIHITRW